MNGIHRDPWEPVPKTKQIEFSTQEFKTILRSFSKQAKYH